MSWLVLLVLLIFGFLVFQAIVWPILKLLILIACVVFVWRLFTKNKNRPEIKPGQEILPSSIDRGEKVGSEIPR